MNIPLQVSDSFHYQKDASQSTKVFNSNAKTEGMPTNIVQRQSATGTYQFAKSTTVDLATKPR